MHLFSKEHHLLGGYALLEREYLSLWVQPIQANIKEVSGDDSSYSVTAAFFGDGTCNNGQFFECLNMAQLWKLPIILSLKIINGL